jgi:hypothetical protein
MGVYNMGDWRAFLESYSQELLATSDLWQEVPEDVREGGWMGYSGATDTAIAATERRLGRALPPSLRTFYIVTNGWRQTFENGNGVAGLPLSCCFPG